MITCIGLTVFIETKNNQKQYKNNEKLVWLKYRLIT